MKIFNFLKKLNNEIKNKNINSILFSDSYGGIHHFFFTLEDLIKKKERFLIICANKDIYYFLKNIEKIKKLKIEIFFYEYKNNLLLSFIKLLPLILLKHLFTNIKNFYSYKLAVDPLRFLIINIFFRRDSKIIVRDQFIKFYSYKKITAIKKLILNIINQVLAVELNLYYHRDLSDGLFPSIHYNYYNSTNSSYTWKSINNFFFNKKIKKIKNSLIIIDDTIQLLDKTGLINFAKDKENISNEINKFIINKSIKYIYIKDHPTSKRPNYLAKLIKNKKIIKLSNKLPLELYIENFEYCIFSNTSCFYFKKKIKLYNVSKKLRFNKKIYKKNYFYLLDKTSMNNHSKINFF